jgi:GNAT superfamily N-acetyltransferase
MTKEVTTSLDPAFAKLLDLYHREFPRATREPDEQLYQEIECRYRIPFRFFVIESGKNVAGFVRWAMLPKMQTGFIIHLAVDERFRKKGFGRQLVLDVRKQCGNRPILAEVEDTVFPWWEARGAKILTPTYTQPALHADTSPVLLNLISMGPVLRPPDTIRDFYREVWELGPDENMVKHAVAGAMA